MSPYDLYRSDRVHFKMWNTATGSPTLKFFGPAVLVSHLYGKEVTLIRRHWSTRTLNKSHATTAALVGTGPVGQGGLCDKHQTPNTVDDGQNRSPPPTKSMTTDFGSR
ncbi:unnamed protein product, partial [Scytosiphon promiscuus]